MRLPKHIGIIPDGNRRWAENNGLSKEKGYNIGINPGLVLFKLCENLGIKEITYYGFTTDNTKRPTVQKDAFIKACIAVSYTHLELQAFQHCKHYLFQLLQQE